MTCALVHAADPTGTLLAAVHAGDFVGVETALSQGGDVEEAALEHAQGLMTSWPRSRNVYNNISDAIKARMEQDEDKARQAVLQMTPAEILLYSVNVPENCNLTMAQVAISQNESIVWMNKNPEIERVKDVAEQKSTNSIVFGQNDCSLILDEITSTEDRLQRQEEALSDDQRLNG